MMLRTLVTLLLFFINLQALATESFQARLATQSVLADIQAYQDSVIAVGERGHVLISTDGNTWQQQEIPSSAFLTSVSVHQQKVWVVGHDAVILHKAAADQEWVVQQFLPELEKPLLDVLFFNASEGIAVGAYGSFYRTLDAGVSWKLEMHAELLHPDDLAYLEEIREEDEAFYQEELASILPHLNRISVKDERLYIAGEAGLLAYSEDFGRSWQRMQVDYQGSFFDIRNTSKGLIAAGLRGNVFAFDAQTNEWTRVEADTTSSFNSIVQLNNSDVLLVGNNGRLLSMTEAGNTVSQTEEGQPLVNAIEFKQSIIAVGTNGIQNLDFIR